uniref:Peptidylprolyl isomerase n=1 Tax=Chromera velia CCMP2878 TaxID=1169474 RepID=A0A0G4FLK7_9ALVE|eukprot:Cvel_17622.t1-p1 / transcript=Cvel_17622.t1 / gene=Cvel_17622 / organism=Chromera_velia_CCMP2878 / gene_product=hypothetical protein / transcript_product=hypothetical protein / location=Cvel_scaffold1418:9493-19808(-) / protein_length=1032 / sequence_SO=supercontig / SO=protein_coding / is_pseudo=false
MDSDSEAPAEDWKSDDEPPEFVPGDEILVDLKGRISKVIRTMGKGYRTPGMGDEVEVRWRRLEDEGPLPQLGSSAGPPWEDRRLCLGYGQSLPACVLMSVRTMREGERAVVLTERQFAGTDASVLQEEEQKRKAAPYQSVAGSIAKVRASERKRMKARAQERRRRKEVKKDQTGSSASASPPSPATPPISGHATQEASQSVGGVGEEDEEDELEEEEEEEEEEKDESPEREDGGENTREKEADAQKKVQVGQSKITAPSPSITQPPSVSGTPSLLAPGVPKNFPFPPPPNATGSSLSGTMPRTAMPPAGAIPQTRMPPIPAAAPPPSRIPQTQAPPSQSQGPTPHPPADGKGAEGSANITETAEMKDRARFEVELLSLRPIQTLTSDGRLLKQTQLEGDHRTFPRLGDVIQYCQEEWNGAPDVSSLRSRAANRSVEWRETAVSADSLGGQQMVHALCAMSEGEEARVIIREGQQSTGEGGRRESVEGQNHEGSEGGGQQQAEEKEIIDLRLFLRLVRRTDIRTVRSPRNLDEKLCEVRIQTERKAARGKTALVEAEQGCVVHVLITKTSSSLRSLPLRILPGEGGGGNGPSPSLSAVRGLGDLGRMWPSESLAATAVLSWSLGLGFVPTFLETAVGALRHLQRAAVSFPLSLLQEEDTVMPSSQNPFKKGQQERGTKGLTAWVPGEKGVWEEIEFDKGGEETSEEYLMKRDAALVEHWEKGGVEEVEVEWSWGEGAEGGTTVRGGGTVNEGGDSKKDEENGHGGEEKEGRLTVTLLNISDKMKDIWALDEKEKRERAERWKELGSLYLKAGKVAAAIDAYTNALDVCRFLKVYRLLSKDDHAGPRRAGREREKELGKWSYAEPLDEGLSERVLEEVSRRLAAGRAKTKEHTPEGAVGEDSPKTVRGEEEGTGPGQQGGDRGDLMEVTNAVCTSLNVHSNLSHSLLLHGQRDRDALHHAETVLCRDPGNVKCQFRKAKALLALLRLDDALEAAQAAAAIDGKDPSIQALVRSCQKKIEVANRKEKQAFKGIFR